MASLDEDARINSFQMAAVQINNYLELRGFSEEDKLKILIGMFQIIAMECETEPEAIKNILEKCSDTYERAFREYLKISVFDGY